MYILAEPDRKLTLFFLANDVIQSSKKKGPEFGTSFGSVLKRSLTHIVKTVSPGSVTRGIQRIIKIWGERGVYDGSTIAEFQKVLGKYIPIC